MSTLSRFDDGKEETPIEIFYFLADGIVWDMDQIVLVYKMLPCSSRQPSKKNAQAVCLVRTLVDTETTSLSSV